MIRLAFINLLFACILYRVSCFSHGILPYCDLGSSRAYGVGNLMNWATPPASTTLFTIRTGDGDPASDPTTYVADMPVSIHIRATTQERYLGIVLYAIRSSGYGSASEISHQVGSWTVSPGTPFQVLDAGAGGTCVTQNSPDWKAVHTVFYWKAPQSTGRVTFRVLLKIGEQNSGAFVYPVNELSLNEDFPRALDDVTQTRANESCHAACNRAFPTGKMYCHRASTAALRTSQLLTTKFVSTTCRNPLLTGCSVAAPSQDTTGGFCMFNALVCGQDYSTHCLATDEVGQRFCVCSNNLADAELSVAGGGGTAPPAGGGGSGGAGTGSPQASTSSDSMPVSVPVLGGAAGGAVIVLFAVFAILGLRKKRLATEKLRHLAKSGVHDDVPVQMSPLHNTYRAEPMYRAHPDMPVSRV